MHERLITFLFAEAGAQPPAEHSSTGLVLILGLLLALIAFQALRGLFALAAEVLKLLKRPLGAFGGLFALAAGGCLVAFLLLPWHG